MPIDYLRDDNDDLLIQGGDFAKGDATQFHQRALLLAEKGQYKQSPTKGCGLRRWINDEATGDTLKGVIQKEFEDDGMSIKTLDVKSFENLSIEAPYDVDEKNQG